MAMATAMARCLGIGLLHLRRAGDHAEIVGHAETATGQHEDVLFLQQLAREVLVIGNAVIQLVHVDLQHGVHGTGSPHAVDLRTLLALGHAHLM